MTIAANAAAARQLTLDELRNGERFVLVTHEHPDGDALGSLVAMHGVLVALGKDAVMFMSDADLPVPDEYRFLDFGDIVSTVPADLDERVVVFLDCGNIDRNPVDVVKRDGSHIVNIDHHHDNTRFGDVDLVVPEASCTAEIVWDLMNELEIPPTLQIAEALYVGLVTDTGQFMYENTGPRAHAMAASLIEAGVDVHGIYRRLYEGTPPAKVALLGRALSGMRRYDDGRLTMTRITRDDFELAGADDSHSEGVVDHLRAVRGTKVAALVRERAAEPSEEPQAKVSLRASDGDVDVSIIARAGGGGGHRQAAGFTTTLGADELVAFLRREIGAQLR
ncbi:MAG TPA: DHH family phosphoesterase [Solirubrobacteraceae bacterium]|nr:DHH family phosphoesterase [Solirubrobacteraceae bacterium]